MARFGGTGSSSGGSPGRREGRGKLSATGGRSPPGAGPVGAGGAPRHGEPFRELVRARSRRLATGRTDRTVTGMGSGRPGEGPPMRAVPGLVGTQHGDARPASAPSRRDCRRRSRRSGCRDAGGSAGVVRSPPARRGDRRRTRSSVPVLSARELPSIGTPAVLAATTRCTTSSKGRSPGECRSGCAGETARPGPPMSSRRTGARAVPAPARWRVSSAAQHSGSVRRASAGGRGCGVHLAGC